MRKMLLGIMVFGIMTLSACGIIWNTGPGDVNSEPFEYELHPGKDTVNVGESWEDPGATIHFEGESYEVEAQNSPDTSETGVYDVTYSLETDDARFEVERKVAVIDDRLPELTLNEGVDTIEVGETWENAGVTLPEGFSESNLTVEGEVNTEEEGTYYIEYIYENDYGNTKRIERVVNVIAPSTN